MRTFILFIAFLSAANIAFAQNINLFPGEHWKSGEVSLGNGGDSLFYYLFKSRNISTSGRELVIWLNGGPGCSSSFGLFTENGPYLFNKSLAMNRNPFSWNEYYDVVFVDQPVGTFYAGVKDFAHYCQNETCVARGFYTFLLAFMELYPEYKGVPLYLTGESYAGHYIPAITAYTVRAANKNVVNLKASAIGNGLTDMQLQIGIYPDFVREEGMIGWWSYIFLKACGLLCQVALENGMRSFDSFCITNIGAVARVANVSNYYDIRRTDNDDDISKAVLDMMNRTDVQKSFGVSYRNLKSMCDENVYRQMWNDWCSPVTEDIAYSLEHGVRILLYYGDKDYICNWRGGEALARNIQWTGLEVYKNADVKYMELKGKRYGEYRKARNFAFLRVYEAGHMVPGDQGEFALHMLKKFVEDDINQLGV